MNCTESQLLLHAHADGELDIGNSLELERHLKACARCNAEHQSVRSLKTMLRQPAFRHGAPEALRRGVRRLGRNPGSDTSPRVSLLWLWKSIAFGATAVAALVIALRPAISERDQLANEAVASHVRTSIAGHLTDVTSSDQHTVKPWFEGKLDFAPDVKDFAPQGFPLLGGRLDYLNNRAVAALVYRRNQHLINVFIWPEASGSHDRISAQHRRGFSVINAAANGLHFCFVSDLNELELTELANLFTR